MGRQYRVYWLEEKTSRESEYTVYYSTIQLPYIVIIAIQCNVIYSVKSVSVSIVSIHCILTVVMLRTIDTVCASGEAKLCLAD